MFKKLCFLFLFLPLSAEVFEGYTLFTPQVGIGGNATTYLIDNDHNIIQLCTCLISHNPRLLIQNNVNVRFLQLGGVLDEGHSH